VLVHQLATYTEWPWLKSLGKELHHVQWAGFHFYDLIFPLFLFLAGVAIPYSLGRKRESGTSKKRLLLKVAIRVFLLILLGVIYNGGLALKPLEETRIFSVLGLIGTAYGLAAVIYLYANPRTMIVWVVGILLGYWAILAWIPVPDIGSGVLTAKGSLPGYLDRTLFPWRLNNGTFDPEGFLPSLAATATALMGALTGIFLRHSTLNKLKKSASMFAAGLFILALSSLWGEALPIVKKMWTSSFIFHCAGWSLVFLSLFYFIIDALGYWRWSFFFIVIGMNPIMIYLGSRIIKIEYTSQFLFGGLVHKFDPTMHAWLAALAYILTWWLVLFFFYRRKCFLKI
jgi:predicted acyltransferase